jgi:hypothetical protein
MKLARVCFFVSCCCALLAQPNDTTVGVTPEPSTIILLGAGLAGLGVAAWRRNRAKH